MVAFQKLKHQVLCYSPEVKSLKDINDNTLFWINQDFCIVSVFIFKTPGFFRDFKTFLNILRRNNKSQYRGKLNLIGRLQFSTEKNREEENQEIVFLRTERTKVYFIKNSDQFQTKNLYFIN